MYYHVIAKCGHVGRNNYILKSFYVKADSGEDAAQIVRYKPRVKHDRKDAIISVETITEEKYLQGIKEMKNDMYFHSHSRQQQIKYNAISECEVFKESSEEPVKYKKTYIGQHLRNQSIENEWNKMKIRGQLIDE